MQKIDICNMALAALGQAPIAKLDEDSERARRISLFYEPVRKELLRQHNWAFATRFAKLSPVEIPEEEYPLSDGIIYAYPANALFVTRLFVAHVKNRIHFKEFFSASTGKKCIACPFPEVSAEYTQDITDTELFSPDFAQTFSLALAANLAMTLTGDVNLAQLAMQRYVVALDAARLSNKQEGEEKVPMKSDLWEVR